MKQLKIKVPTDVHKAAHFILEIDSFVSFISVIIKAPIRGKKIAEIIEKRG